MTTIITFPSSSISTASTAPQWLSSIASQRQLEMTVKAMLIVASPQPPLSQRHMEIQLTEGADMLTHKLRLYEERDNYV